MPSIREMALDFTAETDSGEQLTLSSLRGKKVVLYFYPKDNTSGCTKEACEFRDNLDAFTGKNTVVVGVSTDSVKTHQNFRDKYEISFTLVADPDKEIVAKYGVYVEKKNYGRTYMGVVRKTFLIDEAGKITKAYDKVRVAGHVDQVLADA